MTENSDRLLDRCAKMMGALVAHHTGIPSPIYVEFVELVNDLRRREIAQLKAKERTEAKRHGHEV